MLKETEDRDFKDAQRRGKIIFDPFTPTDTKAKRDVDKIFYGLALGHPSNTETVCLRWRGLSGYKILSFDHM